MFGVHRRRAQVVFERAAARFGRPGMGRIDVFWPGLLLAEHKSAGADLTAAYTQATDYFAGIPGPEPPRHIERFGFIAGYADVRVRDQDPLNIRAIEQAAQAVLDTRRPRRPDGGARSYAGDGVPARCVLFTRYAALTAPLVRSGTGRGQAGSGEVDARTDTAGRTGPVGFNA